jgi:hypothetical protein
LIQTKWGQGGPYNNLFINAEGNRVLTGCGNIAWAQLVAFHRHPARGRGETGPVRVRRIDVPSVNLNTVVFDWNNILNSYRSDGRNSTELQRNAVATLVFNVAAARGPYSGSSPRGFVEFLGYDRSAQRVLRMYYTDAEWEAIIRQQLDVGLPVYYRGDHPGSDHGFIIDGYDSTGRFHINWGWNGRHDGWYFLNNFNPGGGNRRWYRNHAITINFKPDAGGVSTGYEIALRNISASKTSVTQNELFTTSTRINNVSAFDNFPGGQIGAALVNDSGEIVEVIGMRNRAALNPQTVSGNLTLNCFVPETVRPGQYRLMIVIRQQGGDWRIITKSAIGNNIPNAINIDVAAERGAIGGGHGLALSVFTVDKTTVSQNETFTVTARTTNRGMGRWNGGQTGAALVDNNGDIVAIVGHRNTRALSVGYSNNTAFQINCTVPNTVRPGRYQLRIIVRPTGGEWRIATLTTNVPTSIDFIVR